MLRVTYVPSSQVAWETGGNTGIGRHGESKMQYKQDEVDIIRTMLGSHESALCS